MKKVIESLIKDLDKVNKEYFTKDDVKSFIKVRMEMLDEQPMEMNGILLFPSTHEVHIDEKKYILPKKQFKILRYLMMNQNKCISRDKILLNCWEEGVVVGIRTIDVHICKIKKIFNKKIKIYNQKGVGFKLISNEV
jgi:DNA-binding response OmpR family regulator